MFEITDERVTGTPATAEVGVTTPAEIFGRGHGLVAGHSCVALDPSAVHWVPPFAGVGLVQVRVSALAGNPQAVEQVVGVKALQPPFTGAGLTVT